MDKTHEVLRGYTEVKARESGEPSDQQKGLKPPPVEKPFPEDAKLVDLVHPDKITVGNQSVREVIAQRRSRRKFSEEPLTLEELSYLLWATQGVREITERSFGKLTFRTVPSGGSRHPFETYLSVHNVEGVEPGLYRYLALEHKLLFLKAEPELPAKVAQACLGQEFAAQAAVVFIWTAIPYRTTWRYPHIGEKIVAQDSGHLCQNLYLAAESINAGTCAIGAYSQEKIDSLIGVDSNEEFTIYIAPVGKPALG